MYLTLTINSRHTGRLASGQMGKMAVLWDGERRRRGNDERKEKTERVAENCRIMPLTLTFGNKSSDLYESLSWDTYTRLLSLFTKERKILVYNYSSVSVTTKGWNNEWEMKRGNKWEPSHLERCVNTDINVFLLLFSMSSSLLLSVAPVGWLIACFASYWSIAAPRLPPPSLKKPDCHRQCVCVCVSVRRETLCVFFFLILPVPYHQTL